MRKRSNEQAYLIWGEEQALANFAPFGVKARQRQDFFPTTEHYYQMCKFLPEYQEIRDAIKNAPTASEAKRIAAESSHLIRPDWEQLSYRIMKGVVRAKLRQHSELRSELLATGDKIIIEHADKYAPKDPNPDQIESLRKWGMYRGEGENWMGEILMELREELREKRKL